MAEPMISEQDIVNAICLDQSHAHNVQPHRRKKTKTAAITTRLRAIFEMLSFQAKMVYCKRTLN